MVLNKSLVRNEFDMQKLILSLIVLVSISAAAQQQPEVFLFDAHKIVSIQQKLQQHDTLTMALVKAVIQDADKMLALQPGSVMTKAFTPPSGNKHDYMSLAPYFWPDSSKPDGLPYIRKDGQRNPMIDKITDKKSLVDIGRITHTLALAYSFTGEKKYAQKASVYLRTWFIDTATCMNPNLTYAQAVLGVNDGRGIGIIETVSLTEVVDAIGMLASAKTLTLHEQQVIHAWFESYLNWMLTSKNGIDEHHALNNHGIWYDMQVLSFALFLHKQAFAKEYIPSILSRIPVQIEKDGKQPLELERTTALGYSTFSLEAWFKTAILAAHLGVNIWNYETSDGRGIRKALDWLIPYATGEKKWEYQQIKPYTEIDKMYFLLIEAAKQYQDEKYSAAAKKIRTTDLQQVKLLYGSN